MSAYKVMMADLFPVLILALLLAIFLLGLLSHKIGSLDFSLLVSSLPSQYEDSQTAFTDEAFLPSLSTICSLSLSEKKLKEDAVKNGFGFIDIAAITGSLWSTLRPGDAGACGCHFCVDNYDEAVNFSEMDVLAGKWRGRVEGSVCSTLANLLATEICDGEREQFI